MNFLANENFPLTSIKILRNAGYDVASIIEETPGAKDIDVIRRANLENRIILTFDRDYGELIYRYNYSVPGGLVYFRFDPSTPEAPAKVLTAILQKEDLSLIGKFTVIDKNKIRQRRF